MPRSSAQTRKNILDAGYALFRRKGFTRVSMDDIASSANLTKRTLYYHLKARTNFSRLYSQLSTSWHSPPSAHSATASRTLRM